MSYVQYDSSLIQEFAEKMYSQAQTVIVVYTLLGTAAGGGGGYALGHNSPMQHPIIAVGIVVLGALGYLVAQPRAFQLRLQAQMALCQMKIEENTRDRRSAPPMNWPA